jgi:hypothetical protein
MNKPSPAPSDVLTGVMVVAVSLALIAPLSAQAPPAAARQAASPRTPWGDPDLQGKWNNTTMTPLERPAQFAGKAVLTEEEAAGFQRQELERTNADRRDGASRADVDRAYNEMWFDRGKLKKTMRTSLVVDPPDGRIPAFTPEGKEREAARIEARQKRGTADSWEDRPLTERCLLNHGVPPLPTGYNNNYQILQSPGYVVILYEMLYEPRIIPLVPPGGRPRDTPHIRQWKGNSRGHWEGRTLVVDTTDFSEQTMIRGINFKPSDALHIVERFTRLDADTIDYQATIDDSRVWTRPWTVAVPMTKTDDPLFEYACHEGNYGMFGILSGARAEDRASDGGAAKTDR